MQLVKSIVAPFCTFSVWPDVGLVIRTHTGHVVVPPSFAFEVTEMCIVETPAIFMNCGV